MIVLSLVQVRQGPPTATSSLGQSSSLPGCWYEVQIPGGGPCSHRIMAITSVFQADDVGSIPADRSIFCASLNNCVQSANFSHDLFVGRSDLNPVMSDGMYCIYAFCRRAGCML